MTYEEWEAQVHPGIKREPVWSFVGYRKALFLCELAWDDCGKMAGDRRGRAIAEQLIRSCGSICANIEEGNGRGFGRERNWFFRVALGSARESKGWYWRARHLLGSAVLDQRLALSDEVIALLVTELANQQNRARKSR